MIFKYLKVIGSRNYPLNFITFVWEKNKWEFHRFRVGNKGRANSGAFPVSFSNFPEIFMKFTVNIFGLDNHKKWYCETTNQQINTTFSTIDFQKNNIDIMPDPSITYIMSIKIAYVIKFTGYFLSPSFY